MVVGWLCMAFAVGVGAAIWAAGRWAMQGNGQGAVMGFWISLVAGSAAIAFLFIQEKTFWVWQVWVAGSIFGVAFSIGFCTLIMHCLKIGPTGPTAVINNMAMVCGVAYNVFWLGAHIPTNWLLAGIFGVCISLVLFGVAKSRAQKTTKSINPLWLKLVLAGGAFSGLTFMSQTHVAVKYPEHLVLFVGVAFSVSALVLFPMMLAYPQRYGPCRERTAGIGIGFCQAVSLPLALSAVKCLSVEIVFPVRTVGPVILILLLSHFMYGERIGTIGWLACLLGTLSLAILAYGSQFIQ